MKSFFVALVGLLCGVYLLNPTWGVIEIIPDNIPFIGNIDEATAAAGLIACLRYFGFDVTRFWKRKRLPAKADNMSNKKLD
ncbi:MAG: DUF1232 domain-containing protein [Akkermansiaceae bacterium]